MAVLARGIALLAMHHRRETRCYCPCRLLLSDVGDVMPNVAALLLTRPDRHRREALKCGAA